MIFVYGSLVNPLARPPDLRAVTAELVGWRRAWAHRIETPQGNVCGLTVALEEHATVKGIVLLHDGAEPFDFDEREIGYERVPVAVRLIGSESPGELTECFVYAGHERHRGCATREFPIWRSYLDCVALGFLHLGGVEALDEFISSTSGWDAPILDDRASPKYPRALTITAAQELLIEDALRRNGVPRNMLSLS